MRAAAPRQAAAAHAARVQDVLLTATLCLLAGGAVMVYSASSARDAAAGRRRRHRLPRQVPRLRRASGFVAMHVLARRGLRRVVALTGPLLRRSRFVLLVAVELPGHRASTVNGARRWLGAGPLTFQPSEVAKLALVLYGGAVPGRSSPRAHPHAARSPCRCCWWRGTCVLLVATQPDLGTALVIAFTLAALLVAAGVPMRYLAHRRRRGRAASSLLYAMLEPYRRARLTVVPRPVEPRRAAPASRPSRARSRSAPAGSSGAASASRSRRSSTCPRPTPTSSSPIIGEELGARRGDLRCSSSTGCSPTPGCGSPRRPRARYAKLLAAGHHVADPLPGDA